MQNLYGINSKIQRLTFISKNKKKINTSNHFKKLYEGYAYNK